jgi:triosephosphate isomerase
LKENIKCDDWMNVVIAYEPVWALNNNQEIFPEEIDKIHSFIRKWIEDNVSEEISNKIRIIYGGQVDKNNAERLIMMRDIDGFLLSETSVTPEFKDIVETVN